MDKLVEHTIKMLEIVDNKRGFYKDMDGDVADIARAVYDTILRVQILEYKAYRKTEPQTCSVNGRPYDCGNCEYHKCTADEPQTDYGDYERAVEQMQHDMRYESTYNAEDGSM